MKLSGFVKEKLTKALNDFSECFPAEQSENYVYQKLEGYSWTEGFWTGMLWLAYEMDGSEVYRDTAEQLLGFFDERLDIPEEVKLHDLGFLYTLSCVAAYKITGNKHAKASALRAAELLALRYREKGKFIQAWGELDDPDSYRLIIDCLMNLPLLFWAGEETGDNRYTDIASNHLKIALSVLVREDATTHHTFWFDLETGRPVRGETHQGYSDNSCWARGQAWGIYGIALGYAYTKQEWLIPLFERVTDAFIERLPKDKIPYWDMIFIDGDEPRDTSAAAIAICGMLEMSRHIENKKYKSCAEEMLCSLEDKYTTREITESNGLLTDGMYGRTRGDNPECNIWGDYFYMEALMRRQYPQWRMYW